MPKNKTPKKELHYDKKTKTYYEKEKKKWNGLNQEQDSLLLVEETVVNCLPSDS